MKRKLSHILCYSIWLVATSIILYSLMLSRDVKEPFEWQANTSPITQISLILTQKIADQAATLEYTDGILSSIDPADWNSSSPYVINRADSKLFFSTKSGMNSGGMGVKTYPTTNFDSLCAALSGVKNEGGQHWYPPTGYDFYTTCNTNIVADTNIKTPESTLDSATCSISQFKNTINNDTLKAYLRDISVDTTRNFCKTSYQPYKFRTAGELSLVGDKYETSTYNGISQFNSTTDSTWYSTGGRAETSLGEPGIPWLPYLKYAFTLKKACEDIGGGFLMETLEQPVCYFSLGAAINIVNKTPVNTTATTTASAAPASSTTNTSSSSQSTEKPGSKLPWIIGGSVVGGAIVLGAATYFFMQSGAVAAPLATAAVPRRI